MGPDPQVGYHLTNPLIVFAPHLSMTIMEKVGDQCLDSRTFLSLSPHTHSHIHTALIDAGSDSTTLWLRTASPVTIWPLCCEITVWAGGRRCDDKVMPHDVGDDKFWVGGNYSPVLVLPSGTQSPPVWSHCSQSGIPCWNGATGEADSPTKVESNSLRPPSLSSYLPAVTSLSNPNPHCREMYDRCGLTGGRNYFMHNFQHLWWQAVLENS